MFFAAVNHNSDHKQRTLNHRNTQNGSKSTKHKSQTIEPIEVNFCFLRGTELNRKRQLTFEL